MIFLIRRIWHWFYYYFDALRVPHYGVNIRSAGLAWTMAGISAKPSGDREGVPPWRCPVCYDWNDFDWHWWGQCYGGCDGTGIRWAWLRYLIRLQVTLPHKFKWWWYDRQIWRTCCDCGKPYLVLGREVGNHSGCIPF